MTARRLPPDGLPDWPRWLTAELAAAHGLSRSGLARKAKLDPTAFNPNRRIANGRARWPSTETVAKVLHAVDGTMEDFITMMSAR